MMRTQIQLPDELYKRAKDFAAKRELSLAELTRPGLELFLARFSEEALSSKKWSLPKVRTGGLKVPLDRLHDISNEDETMRGVHRK